MSVTTCLEFVPELSFGCRSALSARVPGQKSHTSPECRLKVVAAVDSGRPLEQVAEERGISVNAVVGDDPQAEGEKVPAMFRHVRVLIAKRVLGTAERG